MITANKLLIPHDFKAFTLSPYQDFVLLIWPAVSLTHSKSGLWIEAVTTPHVGCSEFFEHLSFFMVLVSRLPSLDFGTSEFLSVSHVTTFADLVGFFVLFCF